MALFTQAQKRDAVPIWAMLHGMGRKVDTQNERRKDYGTQKHYPRIVGTH